MEKVSSNKEHIITINAGSSSVKVAIFTTDGTRKLSEAAIEDIGQPSAHLVTADGHQSVAIRNHEDIATLLITWLSTHILPTSVIAVGHRIVHGGPHYYKTETATDTVVATLRQLAVFDPEHLPIELSLVETFQRALPKAQQVLCFDTGFHHNLPTCSRLLPIPRHFETQGIRRYGFHGLSYAYITEELRRVEGEVAANGKVIIAHLGSGASLVALHDGKPIDTTMSMTPTSGIPMSTRSGDLDPGLTLYLIRTQGYSADRLHRMVTYESGLLGISETTADMKKLLEMEADDPRAKDAIDIFCYNVTKTIGGFAAALGGLNTLVFTGGIGENAPRVRTRICERLAFLGIMLDPERNRENERLISRGGTSVGVHVIHTDEAVSIARETINLRNKTGE